MKETYKNPSKRNEREEEKEITESRRKKERVFYCRVGKLSR